jgi:hypothetical protein
MQRFASLLTSLTLTLTFGATAFAQTAPQGASATPPQPARIRGTVTSFAGGVLTVQGAGQVYKITVPEGARYTWVVKTDLSKIGPNTYVGTVAVPQPDGTLRATEVQIFPEAQRGVGEGTRPWDTVPNGSMTNATVATIAPETVDKVEGRTMTVKYKDTEKKVFVPLNAPIVTFTPADASALTPGAHLVVNGTKAADGSVTVSNIQIGKDGLTPPM